jgi:Gram-negative bacterial TonB protein C-terminal
MLKEFPRAHGLRLPLLPDDSEASAVSPADAPWEGSGAGHPIVLSTFGRLATRPAYRLSIAFSVVIHVTLIGLTLWLSRKVVLRNSEPVAIVLRRPPPPRPPPPAPETKPEAPRKGARGVSLPKAVARDIEPELELSFASQNEPATTGPTGKWVGGVGSGIAQGPGWADGVESGMVIRRSRARNPMEINSGWECDFPESEADNKLLVRIRVHVSESGRPMHVTVISPTPRAFNASAIECAMHERFRPAVDMTGKPCEGDRELSILFFRTGSHVFQNEPPPPAPPPPPLPMSGPQPDLPVQLDESPAPAEKPTNPG